MCLSQKKNPFFPFYIDLVCTCGLKGFLLSPGAQYWLASCKTNKKKTRNHHKLLNVVLSHTHTLHNQRQFIVFSLFYQAILELCWNHGIFSLLHYLHITLKRKNILTMRTLSNNQTWIMRARNNLLVLLCLEKQTDDNPTLYVDLHTNTKEPRRYY